VAPAVVESTTPSPKASCLPQLVLTQGLCLEKALRDADYSLQFLAEAIASGDQDSFAGYLVRLDRVLTGAGLAQSVLDVPLECMIEVVSTELPNDSAPLAMGYVRAGQARLASSRQAADK
jgi:hypothetical protein